jgi:hypothetical protein
MKDTCCTRSVQRALLATTLSPAAMMREASWMHVGSMAPTWAAAQHRGVRLAAAPSGTRKLETRNNAVTTGLCWYMSKMSPQC